MNSKQENIYKFTNPDDNKKYNCYEINKREHRKIPYYLNPLFLFSIMFLFGFLFFISIIISKLHTTSIEPTQVFDSFESKSINAFFSIFDMSHVKPSDKYIKTWSVLFYLFVLSIGFFNIFVYGAVNIDYENIYTRVLSTTFTSIFFIYFIYLFYYSVSNLFKINGGGGNRRMGKTFFVIFLLLFINFIMVFRFIYKIQLFPQQILNVLLNIYFFIISTIFFILGGYYFQFGFEV